MTSAVTKTSRRLRTSISGTELRIWIRLRGRKLDGWKFRRQEPIGPYFVDFYCPAARLIVEVNGPIHDLDSTWAYDQRRQAWLEAEGYRVLRIPYHWIDGSIEVATDTIRVALSEQAQKGFTRRPNQPSSPSGAFGATSP